MELLTKLCNFRNNETHPPTFRFIKLIETKFVRPFFPSTSNYGYFGIELNVRRTMTEAKEDPPRQRKTATEKRDAN